MLVIIWLVNKYNFMVFCRYFKVLIIIGVVKFFRVVKFFGYESMRVFNRCIIW